jgi:hypothetical protein
MNSIAHHHKHEANRKSIRVNSGNKANMKTGRKAINIFDVSN